MLAAATVNSFMPSLDSMATRFLCADAHQFSRSLKKEGKTRRPARPLEVTLERRRLQGQLGFSLGTSQSNNRFLRGGSIGACRWLGKTLVP